MRYIYLILFFLLVSTASFSQKVQGPAGSVPQKNNVQFFPNPASTTITFEFSINAEKGSNLHIYSFLGRKVLSVPVTGNRVSVNVSNLMKGVYIFQVTDNNGRVIATNKFQVSR